MPPLYENARNDFVVADKYRDEAAEGLRDVLRADAQLLRGQIGIGETISRELSGVARVVNGTIGSVFHSNLSGNESNSDGQYLPSVELSDKKQFLNQNMDSEEDMNSDEDMTSKTKKEKAIYLEKQQSQSEDDDGMTRQIKKEKMNYLDSQS